MHYDPIKELLGRIFNRHPLLRRFFYFLLNVLLLRSWHVRKTLRQSESKLPAHASVLDAGMGFGQYSWWMSRHFPRWTIDAADVKSEQIADCNAFFKEAGVSDKVQAFEADLITWSAVEKYDLILCVDVMEHIEEDQTVFANFYKSLKHGGRLVISTPSDKGGSDVHNEDEESFIGEHVRDGYSINDISDKLNIAGFGKIDPSYTYGKPGSIAWRLSMKYPVMMLSASKLFFLLVPFYYLLVMPLCLPLNLADLKIKHKTGTGLLIIAEKN